MPTDQSRAQCRRARFYPEKQTATGAAPNNARAVSRSTSREPEIMMDSLRLIEKPTNLRGGGSITQRTCGAGGSIKPRVKRSGTLGKAQETMIEPVERAPALNGFERFQHRDFAFVSRIPYRRLSPTSWARFYLRPHPWGSAFASPQALCWGLLRRLQQFHRNPNLEIRTRGQACDCAILERAIQPEVPFCSPRRP